MCPGYEKFDTTDFVAKALREHEKWLRDFSGRLRAIVEKMKKGKRLEVKMETVSPALPVVQCNGWNDFKGRSKGASMVVFEWREEGLTISSFSRVIYRYVLGPDEVKSWLSQELGVFEERVVEGGFL